MLQQDTDITLWGWDTPGSTVTATPSWQSGPASATADSDGRWKLTLRTPKASYTPLEITFSNSDGESKTIRNLLSGEEWLASDRVFYPADATEDWNTRQIIVTSDKVADIKSERYCFRNFAIGKVKNMYGMPLVPFRTDDWSE